MSLQKSSLRKPQERNLKWRLNFIWLHCTLLFIFVQQLTGSQQPSLSSINRVLQERVKSPLSCMQVDESSRLSTVNKRGSAPGLHIPGHQPSSSIESGEIHVSHLSSVMPLSCQTCHFKWKSRNVIRKTNKQIWIRLKLCPKTKLLVWRQ